MENLAVFYDHLVYFTTNGNILWQFGIFCSNLVYFPPVLVFWTKKNLATLICSCKCSNRRIDFYAVKYMQVVGLE
jgi:hypothetical protein